MAQHHRGGSNQARAAGTTAIGDGFVITGGATTRAGRLAIPWAGADEPAVTVQVAAIGHLGAV